MLIVVGELLDHPDAYGIPPETLRELLARLRDLLTAESAKRPRHRPKQDTGSFVATLIGCGASRAKAIRLVAKAERKTQDAVTRAFERHQNSKRQK
ncbi:MULTISPECIES: hypothetical protein [unclassified Bradyrhizobium]